MEATARVVWITGASAGIGRALIETVPWQDAKVIGVSRRGLGDVPEVPGRRSGLVVDLAHEAGWNAVRQSFREAIVPEVESAIFIHAAATMEPVGFVGDVDSREYKRAILLNAVAPQILGEAFLRTVNTVGVASELIMLTSGASVHPGWSSYKPSKAAVAAWVESVPGDPQWDPALCRVMGVAPGYVETDMQRTLRLSDPRDFPNRQKFIEAHHQGRVREPDDVARELWALIASRDVGTGSLIDIGSTM